MKHILGLFLILFGFACENPLPKDFTDAGTDPTSNFSGECRLNSDCDLGYRCEESQCVELEAEELCVGADCPCTADRDCDPRVRSKYYS